MGGAERAPWDGLGGESALGRLGHFGFPAIDSGLVAALFLFLPVRCGVSHRPADGVQHLPGRSGPPHGRVRVGEVEHGPSHETDGHDLHHIYKKQGLHRDAQGRLYSTEDDLMVGPNAQCCGLCPHQVEGLKCSETVEPEAATGIVFHAVDIYTPDGQRRLLDRIRPDDWPSHGSLGFLFSPKSRKVGFSLDSLPGLHSAFGYFAVTPPGFRCRPPGSTRLGFNPPTVPSNRGSALIWESRFSAAHYAGGEKPSTLRLVPFGDLGFPFGLVQYLKVSAISSVRQMVDLG